MVTAQAREWKQGTDIPFIQGQSLFSLLILDGNNRFLYEFIATPTGSRLNIQVHMHILMEAC